MRGTVDVKGINTSVTPPPLPPFLKTGLSAKTGIYAIALSNFKKQNVLYFFHILILFYRFYIVFQIRF